MTHVISALLWLGMAWLFTFVAVLLLSLPEFFFASSFALPAAHFAG